MTCRALLRISGGLDNHSTTARLSGIVRMSLSKIECGRSRKDFTMNSISHSSHRATFRLPFDRMPARPVTPAAATLSSSELKQIVAAMLG